MSASELPPGPRANPLAQLLELRRDFLGYLVRAAQQHGDLVRLRPAPGAVIYLVNHPDLVREILTTNPQRYHKTRFTRRLVGKFLGNGLVLAEGEEHQRQRRHIQPLFHSTHLTRHQASFANLGANLISTWREGEAIDAEQAMTKLSLAMFVHALFGSTAGGRAGNVSGAMQTFAESMATRFRSLPLPDWLPTPRAHAESRALAQVNTVIETLVRERVDAPGSDLVSALLATDAGPLRDQIATLYFAGHETTAKLLTWTLYLLAIHPRVQNRLRAELPGPGVDLAAWTYADQVLCESLRLYPPAWVFDREPIEDVTLGGYRTPKGTTIYLSPYVSHRDPRVFPEPERFDPDRFSIGWENRVSRYSYFPFGTGPRSCIGRGFAMLSAKTVLAEVVKQVWLENIAGQVVRPAPSATLRPQNGLRLRVQRH